MSQSTSKIEVSTPAVRPPSELDFSKPEQWKLWIKRFERYLSVSNLSGKSEREKIDVLCYVMGEKSEEILAQILPNMSIETTYEIVKGKFNEYFAPRRNVVFERYKFNSRIQQCGESADSFITALYTLAEACEFGNLKDDLIRDRIVIGIRDTRTSERLQLVSDLTVNKATEMARQAEIQSREGKMIREEFSHQAEVNRLSDRRKANPKFRNVEGGSGPCGRCGLAKHTVPQKCPAANTKCRRCGKQGHWESVCRSKATNKVNRVEGCEPGEESDEILLGAVHNNNRDEEFVLMDHIR